MRDALLGVLPGSTPGLTEAQMRAAALPTLPADLYPAGEKRSWWLRAVQLDLEAKGEIVRSISRPPRWHRPAEVRRPISSRDSRTLGDRPPRWGGNQNP
jgi:hypothetical protein